MAIQFKNDIELDGSLLIQPSGTISNILDLNKNEFRNAKLHNLNTTARPSNPTLGQIYYDIDKKKIGVCIDPTNDNADLRWYYGADLSEIYSMFENSNSIEFVNTGSKIKSNVRIDNDLEIKTSGICLTQVGTAGTYTKITTDAKGRVVNGGSLQSSDLPTHNHTSSQITDFHTAVRTNKLNQMTAPDASVSMNLQKITNLATPTSPNDAVNKQYCDQLAGEGLKPHLPHAKAATTGNISLIGEQTIDGVQIVTGDIVLVKNQTNKAQNGVYVANSGTWTRSTSADTWDEHIKLYIFVEFGDTNNNSGWYCTAQAGGTLNTTEINFTLFSRAGDIHAGDGLGKIGNNLFAKVKDDGGIEIYNDELRIKKAVGDDNPITINSIGLKVNTIISKGIDVEKDGGNCGITLEKSRDNFIEYYKIVGNGTNKVFQSASNLNGLDKHDIIQVFDNNGNVVYPDIIKTDNFFKIVFKNPVANGTIYYVNVIKQNTVRGSLTENIMAGSVI